MKVICARCRSECENSGRYRLVLPEGKTWDDCPLSAPLRLESQLGVYMMCPVCFAESDGWLQIVPDFQDSERP